MIPIKNIMTTNVLTVSENTSIFEALDKLLRNRISGMPVLNGENEVVGILSEKDILKILMEPKLRMGAVVADYMCRDVISFTEEDDAVEVCRFFMNTHFRRVPVVRNHRLVGIVSRRDVVHLILDAKARLSEMHYV